MAKILIIDDDITVRIAIRTLLQKQGHEIAEASNGIEGEERYKADPPDLIITDIMMPDKDGVETLLAIRSDLPEVKTIVISGNAPEFLPITEDLGAHRTIAKPFENQELLEAVETLLRAPE